MLVIGRVRDGRPRLARPKAVDLPGLEEERLDEPFPSRGGLTTATLRILAGCSNMGGQSSSGHRLRVEKLSRGPSYADLPSSGGSSPCFERKTGSDDGV